ncbi:hypothetical protein [Dactylosporangium sp. CA-139066]|uniref:hypothetical protein n=1 Tax=Dactylosporangium sp. CA-139066 TaxID=3239930 RepID=UPI003D8C5F84
MDQDLRTLLTSVRDDAPPPRLSVDDITAAGRGLVRRRRRLALLSSVGGGAVVAVAALAAAFVLTGSPGAPLTPAVDPSSLAKMAASPVPTAFAEAPPFVTTYRGYTAGSFVVSDPDLVTNAYQQSSIAARPAPSPAGARPSQPAADPLVSRDPAGLLRGGSLVVYRPGVFEPTMFLKAQQRVSTRFGPALLMYSGANSAPTMSANDRARIEKQMQPEVPALAWQYAADSWAAIYWSSWETVPQQDTLVAIADGLMPAAPREFPVGFQHGSLPPGYQLLSVSYGVEFGYGNSIYSAVRLTPKVPKGTLLAPYDFDAVPALTITVGRADAGTKAAGTSCPDVTSCTRILPGGGTYISVGISGIKLTTAFQLSQISLGVKPQNPDDTSAWPAAVKVFP